MSCSCCCISRPESVHAATASCVAYVLRQCGLIDVSRLESDVRQVESCPTFLINDSKAFWLKLSEKVSATFSFFLSASLYVSKRGAY